MLVNLVFLCASLAALVYCSTIFVRGAVVVAKKYHLSDFAIGSVIIAFGTSAPELAINVAAALEKAGDVIVGNIVGSNIVNLCLGLGIAFFIVPIRIRGIKTYQKFFVGLFGALLIFSGNYFGSEKLLLPWYLGIFLLVFFVLFFAFHGYDESDDVPEDIQVLNLPLGYVKLLSGAVGLSLFAKIAVGLAVSIAATLNVPEAVIGATIIAAGGSLPEVASCISAARERLPNTVVGTIAGSQVFNLFAILGITLLIGDVEYSSSLNVDTGFLVGATIALLVLAAVSKTGMRSLAGCGLVGLYVCYAYYLGSLAL